ncbi:MAG: hypothetical protein ABI051_16560 [Vicinamibacterales bacterium]
MIGEENVADADVQRWLQTVGVETRCELEVLAFFHRHRITLLPPEYLARLLGYPIDLVVAALDSLATLQLLEWSPERQGTRGYEFIVPPVLARSEALERLLALSDHRSGRLLLGRHLSPDSKARGEELQAARRQFLDDSYTDLDLIKRFCGASGTVQ